jgi:hypothetical protein
MTTQDYAVTSSQRERSSLSLLTLCGHPRHSSATPGTATTFLTLLERTRTGRRHANHCTSYRSPLTAPSNRPVGGGRTASLYATTLEVAPVRAQDTPRHPNRSKILQDGRQLCGTTCHASTRRRIVWHTCKLLSPWPIKGRAIPQPQGRTTDSDHTHALHLHHGCTAPVGTRIKPSVISCLAPTHREAHLSAHY